ALVHRARRLLVHKVDFSAEFIHSNIKAVSILRAPFGVSIVKL
ncbi:15808_t:CDS:1, partial [Dentiscutata erythropus]